MPANFPGLGVLINQLFGDRSLETLDGLKGEKIASLKLEENSIFLGLDNGAKFHAWDDGQSCCERRYVTTDDDLSHFTGETITGFEIAAGPNKTEEWGGEHEVEFFRILTTGGVAVFETHNEHNGYYGGFSLRIERVK